MLIERERAVEGKYVRQTFDTMFEKPGATIMGHESSEAKMFSCAMITMLAQTKTHHVEHVRMKTGHRMIAAVILCAGNDLTFQICGSIPDMYTNK